MTGLLRRLTHRRAAGPAGSEAPSGPAAGASDASSTARIEPDGERSLLVDPGQAAGQGEPAKPPAAPSDLPAGLDPAELERTPASSARRGRLRRRLRFLRAARELLLRDLGGFVFELHRTARDAEHEGHRRLREIKLARLDQVETELHALEQRLHDSRPRVVVREAKLERLARVDEELRELERRLADPRADAVVRVPGLGGECPECGELHASDASFCAHCGTPLNERARRARAKAVREEAQREEAAREERARAESAREERTHAERVRDERLREELAAKAPAQEGGGAAPAQNESSGEVSPDEGPRAAAAPAAARDESPPANDESRPAASGDAPTQVLRPDGQPTYAGRAERRE